METNCCELEGWWVLNLGGDGIAESSTRVVENLDIVGVGQRVEGDIININLRRGWYSLRGSIHTLLNITTTHLNYYNNIHYLQKCRSVTLLYVLIVGIDRCQFSFGSLFSLTTRTRGCWGIVLHLGYGDNITFEF